MADKYQYNGFHYNGEISSRNPCKPDCPDRKGGCHAKCDKYQEFDAWKQEKYENRKKYYGSHGWSASAVARAKRSDAAAKSNRRHYK